MSTTEPTADDTSIRSTEPITRDASIASIAQKAFTLLRCFKELLEEQLDKNQKENQAIYLKAEEQFDSFTTWSTDLRVLTDTSPNLDDRLRGENGLTVRIKEDLKILCRELVGSKFLRRYAHLRILEYVQLTHDVVLLGSAEQEYKNAFYVHVEISSKERVLDLAHALFRFSLDYSQQGVRDARTKGIENAARQIQLLHSYSSAINQNVIIPR
jgi:hypothetical protein